MAPFGPTQPIYHTLTCFTIEVNMKRNIQSWYVVWTCVAWDIFNENRLLYCTTVLNMLSFGVQYGAVGTTQDPIPIFHGGSIGN